MEEDEDEKCVLDQSDAPEEPRLAEDKGDDAVVHGVAREAIQPLDDKEPWGIDGSESALACVEEIPDASEEDQGAGYGEDACADGGEAKAWNEKAVRGLEDAEWDVAGHRTGQQQDEEESSKCEEEPHVEPNDAVEWFRPGRSSSKPGSRAWLPGPANLPAMRLLGKHSAARS